MENQHQKIKGYRDLNQEEIDLMNAIKEHAEKTSTLIQDLRNLRTSTSADSPLSVEQLNESMRCITIAKESLQTGQMWLVRAVALPNSF